jgi:hypothetical protein
MCDKCLETGAELNDTTSRFETARIAFNEAVNQQHEARLAYDAAKAKCQDK